MRREAFQGARRPGVDQRGSADAIAAEYLAIPVRRRQPNADRERH